MSMREYAYKGFGELSGKSHWYSLAVRMGDQLSQEEQMHQQVVERATKPSTIVEQIDSAFINVDTAREDANSKGWSQVYRASSFHISPDAVSQDAMIRNFRN